MAQESVATADENGSTKPVKYFGLKPQLVFEAPQAADAIQFYKTAFGAEVLKRDVHSKRKAEQELPLILCAELRIGASVFLVCDQMEDTGAQVKIDGCWFCLETHDIKSAMVQAVNAGAATYDNENAEDDSTDACFGDRVKLKDPFGYVWLICSSGNKFVDVEV